MDICSPVIFAGGGHSFTRWFTTHDISSPIQLFHHKKQHWKHLSFWGIQIICPRPLRPPDPLLHYLMLGSLDLLTAFVAEPWTRAVRHAHATVPRMAVDEHGACLTVHVIARLLTQTSGRLQHNATNTDYVVKFYTTENGYNNNWFCHKADFRFH